jgi:adenylate cyclase
MSFISELQRRNVIRVAIGYLAGAWLLIQILETLFPIFGLAETSIRIVVVILAIGIVPALVLTWVFEWTPEGIRRDEGQAVTSSDTASRRRLDRLIFVVLVLAVAYFAVDKFVFDPSRDAARVEQARQEGRVEAVLESYEDKSIVVLPFANLSPDPDQEYFADGLTEELLNLLAQIAELRVISRSTAFTFKGKEIAVPEVARKLSVSHVLEGSVRKAGDRIRITAQLIEASTDTHLWSQTYDRTLDDIFQIQDDISAQVVSQLRLKLVDGTPRATAVNPQAYDLWIRAHHMMEADTGEILDQVEALLRRALELQPDFPEALYELARVHYRRDYSSNASYGEMQAEVRRLVARMAEVAPDSSYTQSWQGFIAEQWDNDFESAARHYERAVADDPFSPESLLRVVANFYVILGRSGEGEALARYLVDRDPACVICVTSLAIAMRGAGHHQEAAEAIEATLEWRAPTLSIYWNVGAAWLGAGEPGRALEYFDRLADMDQGLHHFARLFALYDLGRTDEFEAEFETLREAQGEDPESMARIYAWTQQNDLAFEWMEKLVETQGPGAAALLRTDFYERVRSDPRYAAFLETNGISPEDLSYIEFNPPFPPALQAVIDRYRAGGD